MRRAHEVEDVHRLGSLSYQTGLFGASPDDQRTGYVHIPVPTDEVAAECHRVAAGWAKSINPLLRHEVEGVHRLGSLGYQTGLFGASPDNQRKGT